jgi:hypothetical protein
LSALAEEQDTRELIAILAAEPTIQALKVCEEQAEVYIAGMRFLYNLCYFSESGQGIVAGLEVRQILRIAKINFHGEFEVDRQCRRLELAIKKNGWRGYVENLIDREMRGERLEDCYLEDASFIVDEVEIFMRKTRTEQMLAMAERAEALEDEMERQEAEAGHLELVEQDFEEENDDEFEEDELLSYEYEYGDEATQNENGSEYEAGDDSKLIADSDSVEADSKLSVSGSATSAKKDVDADERTHMQRSHKSDQSKESHGGDNSQTSETIRSTSSKAESKQESMRAADAKRGDAKTYTISDFK